ncbi:hypothetical protein NHQ30_009248 [Ciborinia camelliae]|nr:hypothetical protein NHQ30_009248 [Ciborinia camelliae]
MAKKPDTLHYCFQQLRLELQEQKLSDNLLEETESVESNAAIKRMTEKPLRRDLKSTGTKMIILLGLLRSGKSSLFESLTGSTGHSKDGIDSKTEVLFTILASITDKLRTVPGEVPWSKDTNRSVSSLSELTVNAAPFTMWTIENDGEVFDGKRLWLVPGKKYLFGRTVSEGLFAHLPSPCNSADESKDGQFVIADKSVSRQHLTIEVGTVGPDDCRNPKTRSKVTLNDQNTKVGTTVNGEQIKGKEGHELSSDVNEICIGRYKHLFRITWYPVALSFSFSSKELKANPLEALYATFSPLDIKVLTEYEHDTTTHVVVKKRNTAKGLRALINGKFIVDDDPFMKAVIDATTPEEDGRSGLEKDFEGNFPDAVHYLPGRGSEPTDEPATAYAPDPLRETMFDGYTFVFYDKTQFETLLAPITDGRGKALFREVAPLQTSVDEFVRYVKNVAGEKGVGEFEDGSEGKGVVVVGFYPTRGDGVEWFQDFARQVALHLDQRLIVQSEFLDAILKKDASLLRRPLEVEMSGTVAPATTPATNTEARRPKDIPSKSALALSPKTSPVVPPKPTPAVASATTPAPKDTVSQDTQFRRVRSRRAVISRFSGFDDDDDDDDPPSAPASLAPMPESMVVEEQFPEESQGLFVSQDPNREPDSYRTHSQSVEPEEATQATRATRKRTRTPIVEEKSYMDSFAPATASFKRQRRERGEPTPPPAVKKEVVVAEPIKKKEKKEVDILALAAQQRERAEAAAKAERESLQQPVSTIDIEEMRKLTIVEDMEVRRSKPAPKTTAHVDESERWDDKWNGRKNFKKFRRRGVEGGPVRAHARVIVPLEEVKKKGHGIGDEYWGLGGEDNDAQRRRRKGKGKETHTPAETQDVEVSTTTTHTQAKPKKRAPTREINSDNEDEELPANPMHARVPSAEPEMVPESEEDEVDPDAFRPTPPIRTPVSTTRSSRGTAAGKPTTQVVGQRSVGGSAQKRAAANPLTNAAPAKRARVTPVRQQVSDSESDEDRFKFR